MTTHDHHEIEHQHDVHDHQSDDYCTCCRVCNLQGEITASHQTHDDHAGHSDHEGSRSHGGHHDHTGHEIMFRNRVRVTAVGDDTALSGIMRLVAEAQQSKSETQLLADKAASLLFYAAWQRHYWPGSSGHSILAGLQSR